jgi:hypothetical protein
MKKSYLIIVLSMILTITFCTSCFAGWLIYHKPAFKGKIVDAETKKPIEGAVVVAMYKKYPIISGPGGGSASIMHIKEALTDKKGEFHISSYTTFIQPLFIEDDVDFIIYKPGYGSHPGRKVYPFHYCGPELLFSKELGTKGQIHRRTKTVSITYGVVELPPLKTRKERLRAVPSTPTDKIKDTPLLYKAINEEYKSFGLKPSGR